MGGGRGGGGHPSSFASPTSGFHKKCVGTRYAKLVFFASGGICESRSAFRCIWDVKCRHTIFHALVGLVRFPQKAPGHVTPNVSVCIQSNLRVT
jgi:hypothetical protein